VSVKILLDLVKQQDEDIKWNAALCVLTVDTISSGRAAVCLLTVDTISSGRAAVCLLTVDTICSWSVILHGSWRQSPAVESRDLWNISAQQMTCLLDVTCVYVC